VIYTRNQPMQELLSRAGLPVTDVDERRARAQLRTQIGRLERQLAELTAEAFPRLTIDYHVGAPATAPRLLGLGDLERVRDELADRVSEARRALDERAEVEARNREVLTALLEAPARHRGAYVSRADVGEPGCGGWRSVPRLGPLGMLMGWWRVKVSSGCPLAGRLAAVEQQLEEEAGGTAATRSGGAEARPQGGRRRAAGAG
jgi:hypothetical protein